MSARSSSEQEPCNCRRDKLSLNIGVRKSRSAVSLFLSPLQRGPEDGSNNERVTRFVEATSNTHADKGGRDGEGRVALPYAIASSGMRLYTFMLIPQRPFFGFIIMRAIFI